VKRATGEVREDYIDSGRDFDRLLSLQGERERYVAAAIAGGMLIQRLVVVLEMDDGGGRRAAHGREILGQASVNGDGVVGAGSVIG